MLLIPCPICGPRPEIEFRYAGEAHVERASVPSELDDKAWVEFLYHRKNPRGLHYERWRHIHGCGRFFNCIRDTASDDIVKTYRAGLPKPNLSPAVEDEGL